jgi:hypothetical protein
MDAAKQIRDKYEPHDPIVETKYIGYVSINKSGIIQFSSLDDLIQICKGFSNTDIEIHIYPKEIRSNDLSVNYAKLQPGLEPDSLLPTALKGKNLIYQKDKILYTVSFIKNCCAIIDGWVDNKNNEEMEYHYLNKVITLYDNGTLKQQKLTDIMPVKSKLCIGNKTDIVGNIPNDGVFPKYILIGNTSYKNKIRIHKIESDTSYIPLYMNGKNEIIGTIDNTDLKCFNVKKEFVRNNNIRYLWIELSDLSTFPTGTLNLNNQKLGSYSFKTVKSYPQILRIKL